MPLRSTTFFCFGNILAENILNQVLVGLKTVGKKLGEGEGFATALRTGQIDRKIVPAKFPHHLPANAARGKCACDAAIFATADGNGHKIPLTVIKSLKKGGAFGTVGGGEGGVFNVTACVYLARLG